LSLSKLKKLSKLKLIYFDKFSKISLIKNKTCGSKDENGEERSSFR